MASIKILWILSYIPENLLTDGSSRWLNNTLKAMRPLVAQMDIIGQTRDPNYSEFWRRYSDYFFSAPRQASPIKKLFYLLGWDYSKIETYNIRILQEIQQRTSKHDYDLVILFGHGANVYLPYFKAKHKMMVPLDAPSGLGLPPAKTMLSYLKAAINRRLIPLSERSYNIADSILVVSDRDRDLLTGSSVDANKIIVYPIVVDTAEFCPKVNTNEVKEPSILFTGVLSFYPNEDAVNHLVKDVFIEYHLNKIGVKCRIAGRSASMQIRELTQFPGVELWEDLPDMRVAFERSMVYVAPMRTGLGMKTKILEAMAMKMPIIGYSLAFNGFADPSKFAIICNSPEEIAHAVKLLINSPKLMHDLGERSRSYVIEHHSLDNVAKFILENYQK